MDKLRKQHRTVIAGIFIFVASWYFYLYYNYAVKNAINTDMLQWVGISLPGIGYLLLSIYEGVGWKIINPSLVFSGKWIFVGTQYSVNQKSQEYVEEYTVWGIMNINQTLYSIEQISGETYLENSDNSPQLGTWRSISFEMIENASRLVAGIEHQMNPNRRSGNVKYALEILTVTKWRDRWSGGKGSPIELSSEVLHCVERVAIPHRMAARYILLPKDSAKHEDLIKEFRAECKKKYSYKID